MRHYFDYNATAPLGEIPRKAMQEAMDSLWGNPSSVHSEGRKARSLLEKARRRVAEALSTPAETIVFTSGGTESVYLGVRGLGYEAASKGAPKTIAVLATEHPCVHDAAASLRREGFEVVQIPVRRDGLIDMDALSDIAARVGVVALSIANHETGVVQDHNEISALVATKKAHLFYDAVQAFGKMELHADELGADALAFSSHKIEGPAGSGCLWLKGGEAIGETTKGAQERGRRPGTEGVLGAIGFGAAAGEIKHKLPLLETTRDHRIRLETKLGTLGFEAPKGVDAPRLSNTVNIRYPGVPAELWVSSLDLAGFAVSAGAACTSGSQAPSPVLLAMGASACEARESIRISLGHQTSLSEIDALIVAIEEMLPRLIAFAS